jgi:hypothetical protein
VKTSSPSFEAGSKEYATMSALATLDADRRYAEFPSYATATGDEPKFRHAKIA